MSSGVANNEEDKKPTEQGGAHINLKVKGQVSQISSFFFYPFDRLFFSYFKFLSGVVYDS
jgi:hypothetical protein